MNSFKRLISIGAAAWALVLQPFVVHALSMWPTPVGGGSSGSGSSSSYTSVMIGYRRPRLVYVSATQVDVENNTDTLNETKIVFPDDTSRSVTEDTATTNKYRRADITATAEFTSGTEDSGLRSGVTETNNLWYGVYAVKSLVDATKFVLVIDNSTPLQVNITTINGRFGANSWVYLGVIKNGDNDAASSSILSFEQQGNFTMFTNVFEDNAGITTFPGVKMASNTGSTSLTYSYSAGLGTNDIPANIRFAVWSVETIVASGGAMLISDDGNVYRVATYSTGSGGFVEAQVWLPASEGIRLGSGSADHTIALGGFTDLALESNTNKY